MSVHANHPDIADRFKACKENGFPLCLERSINHIFKQKEALISFAEKEGFELRKPHSISEAWEIYLDLLSSLSRKLGEDTIAVIESKVIEEIEQLKCVECPIYELEVKRKKEKFVNPIPSPSELQK